MCEESARLKIGIVGSGLIGRAWSMLFASVGHRVLMYDILPEQLSTARTEIEAELQRLATRGALRGRLTAAQQLACISTTTTLETLVQQAYYIQECIPERIELKRVLYRQLDALLEPQTIVASSTSTFMPSLFSAGLQHAHNFLVAHPLNPPYHIPLVELVPSPSTKPEVIARARALMLELGQQPVALKREIEGFASNRIQYAILNEIWRLVAGDIISVADVDAVMKHGLGLRYALLGPWETAHLNADGVTDYFARYGAEINAVSRTFGPVPHMQTGTTLTQIASECEDLVALQDLPARRAKRDEFLMQLTALKRKFHEN